MPGSERCQRFDHHASQGGVVQPLDHGFHRSPVAQLAGRTASRSYHVVVLVLEQARQIVRVLLVANRDGQRCNSPASGIRMPGGGRSLSASIGWAVVPADADDRAELIRVADAALYRAKTAGRDRVVGSQAA